MATPVTTQCPILERLADTGMTVADPREDIRGRTVVDPNGTPLGAVDALFVDVPRRHVRLVRVASGGVFGFGQTKVLVPVEVITHVTPERVVVDSTRQRFAGAVRYDPELAETADAPDVYQHYGFAPFWLAGYVPPIPQDPHRRRDPPIPPPAHLPRTAPLTRSAFGAAPPDAGTGTSSPSHPATSGSK